MTRIVTALIALAAGGLPASADIIDDALAGQVGSGTAGEAIVAIEAHLADHAGDDRALFALGLMRAIRGFEVIAQGGHRYGATSTLGRAGMMIFPPAAVLPPNPHPDPVSIEDLRAVIADAMAHAQAADDALARVDADFALTADVLAIRLDLNGDGIAGEGERLLAMMDRVGFRLRGEDNAEMRAIPVDFDRGDADWLRGYCNLALAAGEFVLAHDGTELFERAGHALFPRNVTPHEYLKGPRSPFTDQRQMVGADPLDLVAMFQLLRFPVRAPERMERCRQHLLAATTHARSMWAHYDAETDNANEWVPNPNQTAAFPRAVVDEDMRAVWVRFIDQAADLLEGEVLLPFWRGDGTQGVNVKRVFTEPTDFSPVLWVQGSGAAPYLEAGDMLDTSIWTDMERVFDERTFRHMFWLN